MSNENKNTISRETIGTWVAAEALNKTWHPSFFASEYLALDEELSSGPLQYRSLGDLIVCRRDIHIVASEVDAEWIIRPRRGSMGVELISEGLGSEKVQPVPNGALVVSPILTNKLSLFYWDEEVFRGKGVTPASNFVFEPVRENPIGWLASELNSKVSLAQLRRASFGTAICRFSLEQLLAVLVPVRSLEEMEEMSQRVSQRALSEAAFGRTRKLVTEAQTRLRPFLLTGATFEERLRNFEIYLIEHHITAPQSGFFIEAITKDHRSDLFVVRGLGEKPLADVTGPDDRLLPQEDSETAKAWRDWYWSGDPHSQFEVFNSIIESPALPTHLLVRTTGAPHLRSFTLEGRNILPSFHVFRSIAEARRVQGNIDLEAVSNELSEAWERLNSSSPDSEQLFTWLRKVYRPAAVIKVMRDDAVAGVYVLFGGDQVSDPDNSRAELEALAMSLATVLKQPSEVIEEASRRESIRRLSWMMHQISGPLMRIDRVMGDLFNFLELQPDIGRHLIPNMDIAKRQAEMNRKPLESYTLGSRLGVLAEAVNQIRSLQYQIRRLKNAQSDPKKELVDVKDLLTQVAALAVQQLEGLNTEIYCDTGLQVWLDSSTLKTALGEVISNSTRELRHWAIDASYIHFVAKIDTKKLFIEIKDNALPVDCKLIKNPFDEDATTYARKGQGTGLGLNIVREIIHRHGGQCHLVENVAETGERRPGVTFRAEFPIEK